MSHIGVWNGRGNSMTYPNSIGNLILSIDQLLESLGISCFVERDALAVALTGTDAPSYEFGLFAFSLDGEAVLLGVRSAADVLGFDTAACPALAIAPFNLAQTQLLLNQINQHEIKAGSLAIDPTDARLTFIWTFPVTWQPDIDLAGMVLGTASAVDHYFRAIKDCMVHGITAADALAAHRARIEDSAETDRTVRRLLGEEDSETVFRRLLADTGI